jgi:ribosomal protein S18 acetylase RimI-like enzyme
MNYPLYRDNLCPKMWHMDEDGYKLDQEVRKMLLKVATDFVKSLKQDHELNIKIHDLVIIGSVANYNWTDYSDIDLHIVVDFSDLEMTKDDAQTMFDAIKTSWNFKHDIKMKGHDVELYVQDIDHEAVSTAEYSVLNDKWIKEPVKQKPNFNKKLIKRKYKEYKNQINSLVKNKDEVKLKKLLEKLYKYRQAGLDKGGELSEENIVFKILRAMGHLDKLKDGINKIYDKKMSVKEGLFSKMFGSQEVIKYEVRSYDGGRKYTATQDGKQIGSATVEDSDEGDSILLDIWVNSSHRNLGIGKKLMAMILKKEKKSIRLEPVDQRTKDWYTRLGFVPTGEGEWMKLKEIAIIPSGYKKEVLRVANSIYNYEMRTQSQIEQADLENILNLLSKRFNVNIDDAHHDIARALHNLRKK